MENVDLTIATDEDWGRFSNEKLDAIVDPMVFRSADVFLRGRDGSKSSWPEKDGDLVWKAISQNIDSLVAFFDRLILADRLPVIDYGFTFDSNVGFDARSFYQRCNQESPDQVLVSVHVMDAAYFQARDAALATLRQRGEVATELKSSIIEELSAFDYAWKPDLSALGPLEQDDELLTQFLFGGLLFGAYAQKTGAAHVLQPKRSRLHLAASLGAISAGYQHENELFGELNEIAKAEVGIKDAPLEINALPSFLPVLLAEDPKTPDELLVGAIKLRNTGMVRDYRAWQAQLIADWRDKGRIDRSSEKEVKRIVQAVMRELRVEEESKFEVKLIWLGLDPSLQLPIKRLWGWVLAQFPGRRFSKLLMRMMLADHEYRKLDRHLATLWNGN